MNTRWEMMFRKSVHMNIYHLRELLLSYIPVDHHSHAPKMNDIRKTFLLPECQWNNFI